MHFVTWPELPAASLLSSESLHSAGRSPAVDFWQARDQTKLCGSRNYYHMHRRTDDAASVSPDGMSEFWVMRARTCGQQAVAPADAAITNDVGQQLVTLICLEGSELDRAFEGAGLVVEGQSMCTSWSTYSQTTAW